MGNFSSKPRIDIGPADAVAMASWMNVDVEWLQHVFEYSFGCGCSLDPEIENPRCDLWRATQEKMWAEEKLENAKRAIRAAEQKIEGVNS